MPCAKCVLFFSATAAASMLLCGILSELGRDGDTNECFVVT